jgi:PQQ system protein
MFAPELLPARRACAVAVVLATVALGACEYVRLLRPSVVRQLDPDVARLVNYLPRVDDPNQAIVARLFAHGGLSHAEVGRDGIMRDVIRVPQDEFIWKPAVIVLPQPGEVELEFQNEDQHFHMALVPSVGDRRLLELPLRSAGRVRMTLDHPGLYWFGCPVGNHAGRGMLGVIIVEGATPAEARLDRPPQNRK